MTETWTPLDYLNDGSFGDAESIRLRFERVERALANLNSMTGAGPIVPTKQQIATLTINRAGGFQAEHVFDLGQDIATVRVETKLSAKTADGETWGTSIGNIQIPKPPATTSEDNATYSTGIDLTTFGDNPLYNVNHDFVQYGISGRYLKVAARIAVAGGADPYAGANNPTATLDLVVDYV